MKYRRIRGTKTASVSTWLDDHHVTRRWAVVMVVVVSLVVLVGLGALLSYLGVLPWWPSSSSSPQSIGTVRVVSSSTGVAGVQLVSNNLFNNYPAVVQMYSASPSVGPLTDSKGSFWLPDFNYSATQDGFTPSPNTITNVATRDQPLFQWSRFAASFYYTLSASTTRTYVVTLLFAETYFGTTHDVTGKPGVGARVFDVQINGRNYPGFSAIDIYSRAGGPFLAYNISAHGVAASLNGQIILAFNSEVDQAQIQGIQVADCTGTSCT